MMNNLSELVYQAEQLYETGQLEKAIEIYQLAVLLYQPRSGVLANLFQAWKVQNYRFIEDLIVIYPDSVDLQLQQLRMTIQYGWYAKTIQLATDMIKNVNSENPVLVTFHSSRFQAAIRGSHTAYIKDDFIFLWQNLHGKSKRKLLEHFLSISSVKFQEVYLALAANPLFSDDVQDLFRGKANLLHYLDETMLSIPE